MKRIKFIAFVFMSMFAMQTIAQTADTTHVNTSKKVLTIEVPNWAENLLKRIKIHGYGQAGYTYEHRDQKHTNTWDLKRVMFWVDARITDRWSFLFMYDFCSVVHEYWTEYRFSKGKQLAVRLGQFKNSYSMENPLSPTKVELINVCSQGVAYLAGCGPDPLYGVNYGRDLGLMIHGELFNSKLYYEFAVMNGQGVNVKDKNPEKDFLLHIEYRPQDNLRFGLSGQIGRGHAINVSPFVPDVELGDDYKRNRWSAGVEWKSHVKGVDYWKNRSTSIRAEVVGGRDANVNSIGGYCTASVPVWQGLDLVGSVDYFNYNTELKMQQMNFTAGIQYWFYKTCRAQVQYTMANPVNMPTSLTGDHYGLLQAQLQVAF